VIAIVPTLTIDVKTYRYAFVRCSMCGEVVNNGILANVCSEDYHTKRRRNRDTYCVHCGERHVQEN